MAPGIPGFATEVSMNSWLTWGYWYMFLLLKELSPPDGLPARTHPLGRGVFNRHHLRLMMIDDDWTKSIVQSLLVGLIKQFCSWNVCGSLRYRIYLYTHSLWNLNLASLRLKFRVKVQYLVTIGVQFYGSTKETIRPSRLYEQFNWIY